MPATTPGGYPYAEPTDPLVQWPATSQQLAEQLEQKLSAGLRVATGTVTTSGESVAFPPGTFAAPPTVLVTAESTDPAVVVTAGITAAAFTVRCFDLSGQAKTAPIHWVAVQVLP
jgi:hypothetical protein